MKNENETKGVMRFISKILIISAIFLAIYVTGIWSYDAIARPDGIRIDTSQQNYLILGMIGFAIIGKGGQKIFEMGGINTKNLKMGYSDNKEDGMAHK